MAHEVAELNKAKNKTIVPYFLRRGHLSPGVLFREHNVIKTLTGKESKKVRKDIINFRKSTLEAEELSNLLNNRFTFGESPRLSRHAIKRIDSLARQKMKDIINE